MLSLSSTPIVAVAAARGDKRLLKASSKHVCQILQPQNQKVCRPDKEFKLSMSKNRRYTYKFFFSFYNKLFQQCSFSLKNNDIHKLPAYEQSHNHPEARWRFSSSEHYSKNKRAQTSNNLSLKQSLWLNFRKQLSDSSGSIFVANQHQELPTTKLFSRPCAERSTIHQTPFHKWSKHESCSRSHLDRKERKR